MGVGVDDKIGSQTWDAFEGWAGRIQGWADWRAKHVDVTGQEVKTLC